MRKTKHKIFILLVLCFSVINNSFADKLDEAQINKLKRSVVRILVNGRVGSGFIYLEGKYAITAYHVVSGSNGQVRVQYPALGIQQYNGTVIKTLKDADIALIEIENFRNVTPLKISNHSPVFDAQYTAIGFVWDAPESLPRTIRKRENKILSTIIPSATRADIERAGCPSLQLAIHSFEDNPMVPGFSGAPIFHSDEGIIGICDGGIKDGVASLSWAIPTHHLNRLMSSTEFALGSTVQSPSHFGADLITNPDWNTEAVTIGTNEFSKVRTETLLNIMNTTDDVTGLNQILSTFPPQVDRSIQFDVYQNFATGACFILPTGFETVFDEDQIKIFSSDRQVVMTIKLKNLKSIGFDSLNINSIRLELEALENTNGWYWTPEPAFTYVMPLNRQDGFIARRKSFIQYRIGQNKFGVQQYYYNKHLFESFIAKKNLLIQLYTVNNNYNNNYYYSKRLPCEQAGYTSSECQLVLRDIKEWMALIAATHFATFSVI